MHNYVCMKVGFADNQVFEMFLGCLVLSLYLQFHKRYLERCKFHGDDNGIGIAYEALSKASERCG